MYKEILIFTMIASQVGIGLFDFKVHEWRTGGLAMIFAVANTVIFWPKGT